LAIRFVFTGHSVAWFAGDQTQYILQTVEGKEEAVPKICAGEPDAFSPEEIDDFVALVLAGGEVNPNGLRGEL
jgi:hypothetical protein